VRNHPYKNELSLRVIEISFSFEGIGTKTRFEKEAIANSEMADYNLANLKQTGEVYSSSLKCYSWDSCGWKQAE